jgi:uncharacterized protein
MPSGKPAGVRCVNLSVENHCLVHGLPEYPRVCAAFTPSSEMCGDSYEEASAWLGRLEALTAPAPVRENL